MSEGTGDAVYSADDRLPWLESVEDDYAEGPSLWRILLLVLLGLAVIGGAVYGYYWYQQNRALQGTGALINAQEGDYKVRPDKPGGMEIEGQGGTRFATGEGALTNGQIDVAAVPEEPVTMPKAADAAPAAAPAVPPVAPAAAPSGGGAIIQLGSFPSEVEANAVWARLSGRFAFLAPLGKAIERADVKGRTVHRLRVNAGSATQARDLCGRLTVAGEACFVVN